MHQALADLVTAQLDKVVKLRDEERMSWEKTVKEAVESAQEAQKKMSELNDEKATLALENRQKDNLIDILREQIEKLRSDTEQHELTIGSLRKQLQEVYVIT